MTISTQLWWMKNSQNRRTKFWGRSNFIRQKRCNCQMRFAPKGKRYCVWERKKNLRQLHLSKMKNRDISQDWQAGKARFWPMTNPLPQEPAPILSCEMAHSPTSNRVSAPKEELSWTSKAPQAEHRTWWPEQLLWNICQRIVLPAMWPEIKYVYKRWIELN